MVKGYKHIFYDISNTNFTITAPTSTFAVAFNGVEEEQNKDVCSSSSVSYSIPYNVYSGFVGSTTFAITGQPAGSKGTYASNGMLYNGVANVNQVFFGFGRTWNFSLRYDF